MTRSGASVLDRITIAVPLVWLMIFIGAPLAVIACLMFGEVADAIPPVKALVEVTAGGLRAHLTTRNLALVTTDPLYITAFWNGIKNAALTAAASVAVGYPVAYAIARATPARRRLYLLLAILPFWVSFLMRAYAWMGLIRDTGPINSMLLALGVIQHPIPILYSPAAVLLVMLYSYLPFFILPMYAVLERLPADLLAAAADLGASPFYTFRTVVLPLSMPGLLSGLILVFVPAVGEYVIPDLVGNTDSIMIGGILWNEFFANRDWPVAATIALLTCGLLVGPAVLLRHWLSRLGARMGAA